jgi:hypothetical protein
MNKCTLFQQKPALLASPYKLRSTVPLTLFRQFVSALEGNEIEITSANISGLTQLCEEFGFEDLRSKLSEFPPPRGTAAKDTEARERTAALKGKSEPFQAGVVEVELCLANERFRLPSLALHQTCTAFQALPLPPHYSVKSAVSSEIFRIFLSAVKGESIEATAANFAGISALCDEFGFKLSSPSYRLCKLEAEFAELKARLAAMPAPTLSASSRGVEPSPDRPPAPTPVKVPAPAAPSPAKRPAPSPSPSVAQLPSPASNPPPAPTPVKVPAPAAPSPAKPPALTPPPAPVSGGESSWFSRFKRTLFGESSPARSPSLPAPAGFDSLIVSDFPEIFAEFRYKQFKLLWRGSRDGFGASEFHRRCDGHAKTLTMILDTKRNIFGGFTPVEWETPVHVNIWKADDSRKSFLFTLQNPHSIAPRQFALKPAEKHKAIRCDSRCGPCFSDMAVSNNCNANTGSCTSLGGTYTNDTRLPGDTVFTGSESFQVKEIEVFEITD